MFFPKFNFKTSSTSAPPILMKGLSCTSDNNIINVKSIVLITSVDILTWTSGFYNDIWLHNIDKFESRGGGDIHPPSFPMHRFLYLSNHIWTWKCYIKIIHDNRNWKLFGSQKYPSKADNIDTLIFYHPPACQIEFKLERKEKCRNVYFAGGLLFRQMLFASPILNISGLIYHADSLTPFYISKLYYKLRSIL